MIGVGELFLERGGGRRLPPTKSVFVQSADVFPAGRRLEGLLVRESDAETGGVGVLFETTEARVDEAFERIGSLERRLGRLEATAPETMPRELHYLVFVAGPDGYQLASAFGRLPLPSDRITGADAPAEVLRVGSSPLPDDRRPCVFAVPAPVPSRDAGEAQAVLAREAA
jgi:hypothetical protein